MSSCLVIVESSAKSKTIQKYLNQSVALKSNGPYKVVASLGHVVDLPSKELGVDTATWELTYEAIHTKKKTLQQLKKDCKEAKQVFLATDPDREGEAIAWHLQRELHLSSPKRVLFHEITPKALEDAMLHPREIDMAMVASQESRRALDRVVGYKVSPLLWKRFTSPGLSAGRVQSVVLRSIVERFQQYESHVPETFWTVEGTFHTEYSNTPLEGSLLLQDTRKKATFEDPRIPVSLLEEVQHNSQGWSITYELKTSHKHPSAPYTTSALQQEVYETYGIPAKSTMQLAQKLYESGWITYMRTDSVQLSHDAKSSIKDYILVAYSKEQYQNREFKSKVANAQEAHECIRPTEITRMPRDMTGEDWTPSHRKVYDIIWRKTVSSQMIGATYVDVHYTIRKETPLFQPYVFMGKISLLQDPGYLVVWNPKAKPDTETIAHWKKQILTTKSSLVVMQTLQARGNMTKPEGLYHEPSIVKWMEREGIGRPSTYATILDKLFEKGYVSKGPNPQKTERVEHYLLEEGQLTTQEEVLTMGGTEKDRFLPTSLGINITAYLEEHLPSLMNYEFTAQLEESLDKVSRKENTKTNLLTTFYQGFGPLLEKVHADRKEHATKKPKERKEKQPLAPKASNILQDYPTEQAQMVQTRFGPALFRLDTKKFLSVEPFLTWKKKAVGELTATDVHFLKEFPIRVQEDTTIEYGRYGLFLMHQKKNLRLPKNVWDSIYHHTYTPAEIMSYVSSPPSS